MNTRRPHDWEEAMNDMADEKQELLDMLTNIVSLWEVEASMSEIENAMQRARRLINETIPKEN
jgi:hypothetical protein